MWIKKKTQYGGDVVMFLPNEIIKNKKLNYQQKKMCLLVWIKSMAIYKTHQSW